MREARQLRDENARLKRLVADLTLRIRDIAHSRPRFGYRRIAVMQGDRSSPRITRFMTVTSARRCSRGAPLIYEGTRMRSTLYIRVRRDRWLRAEARMGGRRVIA
jgi:hypothetical protein